ncbi:MAG TPA: aspartate--tRNA ligase [Solirubrobacterales bacterium]|jgi:aspartyl-tRNA synthetase|nr:aspartate--tRNA ligase [Solirubrobacterales bacterium]
MSEATADDFSPLRGNDYRDTWCGAVREDKQGSEVRVCGWVNRRRDHGGLIFVDLRDRTGIVQLVFHPDVADDFDLAGELRPEDVISVSGEVVGRSEETVNPKLPTGRVEVGVASLVRLADSETPPFQIEGYAGEASEDVRMRYRYLDLRREQMREALELRHKVVAAMREFLDAEGFIDVETPVLTRSTPEGARDFLVPSSQQHGSFYALPQSPQLFKQLLMMSGFERYYQVARCFRDEATRADRQAEFTQLDIEMSFVDGEDIIEVNERLLAHVFERAGGPKVELPMRRMCYDEAMGRFGTDRPDLRFGLELVDLGEALAETEFKVFRSVLEGGGAIRGINAGKREMPRSELDGLISRAQELGAKGLVWAFREGDGWRSPTAKFLSEAELADLNERLGAEEGDLLLLVADQRPVTDAVLGQMRIDLAERFELIDPEANELVWVVDWPLMEWNEGEQRWDSLHHPFTAPAGEFDPESPGAARAVAYDCVWNGQELGGGSIRINRADVQQQVFAALGIDAETAEARFGFLLEALRYGAPPHGGIAYGVDRIVQRLSGADTIRDVIAFPKTASGFDLLTGAPAPVEETQLRDLGVAIHKRKLAGH